MLGRILDAVRTLFLGGPRVEARLLSLERELEFLLVRLNDKCDVFNAAQARAEKSIARRERKEERVAAAQQQRAVFESLGATAAVGSPSNHVSGRAARRNQLRLAAAREEGAE